MVSLLQLVSVCLQCQRLAAQDEGDRPEGKLLRLPAGACCVHVHKAWDRSGTHRGHALDWRPSEGGAVRRIQPLDHLYGAGQLGEGSKEEL